MGTFIDTHFIVPLLVLVLLGTLLFAAGRTARSLRARGLALSPRIPADALFSEKGVTGYRLGPALEQLSGARHCITVWLTRQEVVIDAEFPVNLVMPFLSGLPRVQVPVTAIEKADYYVSVVTLFFSRRAARGTDPIALHLVRPDDLLDALKSLGVPVARRSGRRAT